MLWIALYLPQLPLDLAYRRWPEPLRERLAHAMPIAITESRRIRWANPCAQQAGIQIGMPESSAHARAADVVLIPRDPVREAEGVKETAMWALHFTPQISLLADGLLMDVSASLRLFGGRDALIRQLRAGILEFGLTLQLASAPTATAAWLLANHADDLHGDRESTALLESLPVNLLASAQPHLTTLEAIGCETIRQLHALPRTGITRRFGKGMLVELDRAFGIEPEVRMWFEPPMAFDARLELPSRVETAEALLLAARRLLMQMTGWLVARHAAVSRFSLLLHHERTGRGRNAITKVAIALGNPSRDLSHLTLLLQERLGKIELSSSVIEISLQAQDIVPLAAPNKELFPAPVSQAESMGRLIERLASRLGDAAVNRLSIIGDHRPERCSQLTAVVGVSGRSKSKPIFPARPTWLLPEPIRLLVHQHKPFYQSPLKLLAGPERIEAGWWDDALATRDYYIASNDRHLLLWIYQERQGADLLEPGWFLQGIFG